jgi:uncharacterized protein
MTQDIDLRVTPEQAAHERDIRRVLVNEHGVDPDALRGLRVIRRSIDARQRNIQINLRVRVWLDEEPEKRLFPEWTYPDVSKSLKTAVVVGAGPGGLFAALRLIELGIRPIVVERGKSVHERKRDIAQISREQVVNSESNYSFGEGGAGAFSDGKLYTRSKKRGNVEKILQVFCRFGAYPDILVDAHPHIGTDKLPAVIENMREQIRLSGGEVHFETRMDDLLLKNGRVCGIVTADGRAFQGAVILATGHSARDVYRLLHRKGIRQEAKALALGVRLEHPSALIDQIMYHHPKGRGKFLPAAEYSFATQVQGRGVYSFCMCPGGFVVPAASGPEQVVVNGMSPSSRNSRWSNAGLVVEFHPEDLDFSGSKKNPFGLGTDNKSDPRMVAEGLKETAGQAPELLLMDFQEHLEHCAWQQGGCRQTAPSQRMDDFTKSRLSASLPAASYSPGVVSSPLHEWLPNGITQRLQEGFRIFDRSSKGFLTNEAILLGLETRTSSPVRILRDPERLNHIEIPGLYPCGEGAGYAGGIVSAAIDGERCAESLAANYG